MKALKKGRRIGGVAFLKSTVINVPAVWCNFQGAATTFTIQPKEQKSRGEIIPRSSFTAAQMPSLKSCLVAQNLFAPTVIESNTITDCLMDADCKDQFSIEAVIGMVKSTNHRFRMVTVFKRHNDKS